MTDIRKLQTALGVAADGVAGRGTFAALFSKFGAGPIRAAELALSANVHFPAYGIMEKELRLAHFMAQLVHESGGFRYMEEIASGSAYEGRADLGNVKPGDGVRYKGRGPLQCTGRANYRKFGRKIGIALPAVRQARDDLRPRHRDRHREPSRDCRRAVHRAAPGAGILARVRPQHLRRR